MDNASASVAVSSPMDTLGCRLSTLDEDRRIHAAGLTFHRKKAETAPRDPVATPATSRGYLLGLSFAGGHRRRIFHPHHATTHDFAENTVYLRSFQDNYRAELSGSFDFALLEIGPAAIDRMADGADLEGVNELRFACGEPDPVLAGLMGALFSPASDRLEHSVLFIDQLSMAIGMHVVHRYGNAQRQIVAPRLTGRRLSPRGLAKVQEMIRSRLGGDLSLEELARACNLSESTFLRAFRETVGKTPHQFLMAERVEKARDLLAFSGLPISEIAAICGFADQSHFTRVFSRLVGAAPGVWRRSRRS
ncbi:MULTISPECIES: AraC family transcriptional regulator [unclassified Rhizobium]|uniref:helix-turn-helix domain-containing protein n=1 Tax=unclassified Rhizobium TaxID=2613769 RepID=UPI0006F36B4F|nr:MULTISPECIES: AraC family transcriptional regulator [unclassified Rhizobium]KQV42704.1 AraC family transcriptional regulator [Rhizobium sp. Root1212]KRD36438.1 AraC family transcriptional regulator [Rhizobium sp. Root268]